MTSFRPFPEIISKKSLFVSAHSLVLWPLTTTLAADARLASLLPDQPELPEQAQPVEIDPDLCKEVLGVQADNGTFP